MDPITNQSLLEIIWINPRKGQGEDGEEMASPSRVPPTGQQGPAHGRDTRDGGYNLVRFR